MKGKYILILSTVFLFSLVLGCGDTEIENSYNSGRGAEPDTASITFVRTDSVSLWERPVWKVKDDEDPPSPGTTVHRGDIIIFRSDSSDVELQFPQNYNVLFEELGTDSARDYYRKFLRAGETLRLRVKPKAPPGDVEYAVLMVKDCVLAIGDSVPIIVIDVR